MTDHLVDGIEILLWPQRSGLSAYAAPWTFDLWFDEGGRGTIDANFSRLNIGDYPRAVDRYRALDGAGRARVLKAALARRDDWRASSSDFEHYLVRRHEPGIDESAFLQIVAAFIRVWRRRNGLAP